MENSTNVSILWQKQEKLLQYSSFHNTWFAATGFIANSLSVVLILCSSGLRQHQKINMLSLTLNDLVFMASVFIYGLLPLIGQVQLAREICWPIIYVTMATGTISSMTITHITVVGFLAVSRPWDFPKFTATKRVLSIVICIWCLSWATAMAYFKFDLPIQTRGCSLFLLMPRDGLIVWLFVNITCSFLVIILNIKIIFYFHVRKRVRISETNAPETSDRPDSSPPPDTSGQSEPGPSRADRTTYHTRIQPLCGKYTNVSNAPERFELAACGYRKQANALGVRNTTSTSSSDEQDSNNIPNMVHARTGSLTEHDHFSFVYSGVHRLQVPKTFSEARMSYQGHYKSADRTCASSKNKKTDFIPAQKSLACPLKSIRTDGINRNIPRNLANHQEQQIAEPQLKKTEKKMRTQINVHQKRERAPTIVASDPNGQEIPSTSSGEISRRFHRATVTLVLLTLSCCVFSLPMMLLCLMFVSRPGEREQLFYSSFGSVCKLAAGVNALLNPVLYTWRLIHWATVRSFIVRKLRML